MLCIIGGWARPDIEELRDRADLRLAARVSVEDGAEQELVGELKKRSHGGVAASRAEMRRRSRCRRKKHGRAGGSGGAAHTQRYGVRRMESLTARSTECSVIICYACALRKSTRIRQQGCFAANGSRRNAPPWGLCAPHQGLYDAPPLTISRLPRRPPELGASTSGPRPVAKPCTARLLA